MSYFKVFIYALLTAPLILFNVSHATLYTTGDLSYNDETDVITNQQTQQTYLGWDVIRSYTYDETVAATASGGLYSDYHIADYAEAKTFFEAAMYGTCDISSGVNKTCRTELEFGVNGWFGDNSITGFDYAWFLSSGQSIAGLIEMSYAGYDHKFSDNTLIKLAATDAWADGGVWESQAITWLLVANTTSTVPVPAAIWLFGTALIGLVGYGKRKSKVPV